LRKTKHSRISVWRKNTQNQIILTLCIGICNYMENFEEVRQSI
jgi:uncharacterized membrane protein